MFKVINGLTIDFQRRLIWGPTQKPMTWFQAMNLEKDGWRLPTKDELRQAFIDKVPGFKSARFWSSSLYTYYLQSYVWSVSLFYGDAYYDIGPPSSTCGV